MEAQPRVIAVAAKPEPGVGKVLREVITLVAGHGVEGDYHAGPFVRHRSRAARAPDLPNRRQVHLIHAELFDEVAALGIDVRPGQMGENITTRGLALMDLSPGTRLHLGSIAVVEITGCRNPCNQLDAIDPRLLPEVARKAADGTIARRAGIMGIVVQGGPVRPGDPIHVEVPAEAAGRLDPV